MIHKVKIFNDPVYGFISVPNPSIILDVIDHPYFQRLSHQMISTERMVKSRMVRTRIYIMSECSLGNAPQALKIRMVNNIQDDTRIRNADESINWVVKYFYFMYHFKY